jgi:hypothetical protein
MEQLPGRVRGAGCARRPSPRPKSTAPWEHSVGAKRPGVQAAIGVEMCISPGNTPNCWSSVKSAVSLLRLPAVVFTGYLTSHLAVRLCIRLD